MTNSSTHSFSNRGGYFWNKKRKSSAKKKSAEMVGDGIEMKDLNAYHIPSKKECDDVGINGIHLGDYMFWDDERQTEFISETYGWKEADVEGTYKGYKSNGCVMTGVHDYMKLIKRGFGRTTDHVSRDIRAGLLTREEGFELIKKYETSSSYQKGLEYFLKITGFLLICFSALAIKIEVGVLPVPPI